MAFFSSKWMIVLLIFILIPLILLIIGRKSVHTEIVIDQSKDQVWSVLTNVPEIRDWNKVLIPVDGDLVVGSKVKYEFYQDENGNAAVMDAKVKEIIPNTLINQTGGLPGVLTFNHKYELTSDNEGTKVSIHEEYRGVMVPFWNPKPVEEAYARLLKQLKIAVENKSEDE